MLKSFLHILHDCFLPHARNEYRPHLFGIVSIATMVCAVLVFQVGYLVQTKFVFLNTNFLASVLPSVLADLTNESRTSNGLVSVSRDPLLDSAAQAAAQDMADKGYFAHVSPDGKQPWQWLDQVGYSYSYAGENLAVNFTDSQSLETAWLESPTHRANIMKPQYTRVGFGTANGMYEGRETTFVVEFFATPADPSVEKTVAPTVAIGSAPAVPKVVSPSSAQVLGTQTANTNLAKTTVIPPTMPAPVSSNWFTRFLTSPFYALIDIFTILLVVVSLSFSASLFIRGRFQHPNVLIGGTLLLVLISGGMLFSIVTSGSVILPNDSQTASAYFALP